jgi:hypothetical protein
VLHPFKDFKPPLQNTVGSAALYVRHKTYAAGIMFILRPVHTGTLVPLLVIAHDDSSNKMSLFQNPVGFETGSWKNRSKTRLNPGKPFQRLKFRNSPG